MTVTAKDLIASVQAVEKISKCEADWRGVCGRAYYAIYQDGKAFHEGLKSPGRVSPGSRAGMHGELIERLMNPTISRGSPDFLKSLFIGGAMQTIYGSRVKADYRRDQTIDKSTASMAVLLASSVLSKIAEAPQGANSAPDDTTTKGTGRPSLTVIK